MSTLIKPKPPKGDSGVATVIGNLVGIGMWVLLGAGAIAWLTSGGEENAAKPSPTPCAAGMERIPNADPYEYASHAHWSEYSFSERCVSYTAAQEWRRIVDLNDDFDGLETWQADEAQYGRDRASEDATREAEDRLREIIREELGTDEQP